MAEYSVNEASQVAARKSSNLAFAFFCMEKQRAEDMAVFYAYCRILDDIADEETQSLEDRIKALNAWKTEIENIYSAKTAKLSKMGSEIRDIVMRNDIPKQYMLDIIDGVMRDTDPKIFETVEEIHKYCYGVACAVGLVSIHIFGCKNEKTKDFALALGYAFQFTNILRDVVYDWKKMKRVYIPKAELDAFGVTSSDFDLPKLPQRCKDLFALMHFRAKHYFNRARALLQPEDAKALTPAFIMSEIYEKILDDIAKCDFNISEKIVKVSKPKKILLALRAMRFAKKYSKLPEANFGKAVVLGGGVAGLAAAVNLSLKGYVVDLYESKSHLGGRVSAYDWKQAGVRIDNASHAMMNCCDNFFKFLKILGVEKNGFLPPLKDMQFVGENKERFAFKFPQKGDGFFKSFGNVMRFPKVEGFKVFSNILFLLKLKLGFAKAYENETVAAYLARQNLGSVATSILWEPFCVSVQNTPIEEASADMFQKSIKATLLRGAQKSALLINTTPISDMFAQRAKLYIESCLGQVYLSSPVKALHFEGKKCLGVSVNDAQVSDFDLAVFALPHKTLGALLPECELKKSAEGIKDSPILNIYFGTKTKLFEGSVLGLVGSSFHWIFDRTDTVNLEDGIHFYSITVSAYNGDFSAPAIKEIVAAELEKYFGKIEFEVFLPSLFKDATMLSTCLGEGLRPECDGHFSNVKIVGDWVGKSLPATIENAVKSALF